MSLKPGDKVRFKVGSTLWNNHRHAVGTVLEVYSLPNNGVRVNVAWGDDTLPGHGLLVSLLEDAG
jgi:hypothetical protein